MYSVMNFNYVGSLGCVIIHYSLLCVMKVPQCLTRCHPTTVPGKNYLYFFIIQEAESGQLFQDRSSMGLPNLAFGLLTSKPMPNLKVKEVYCM